ncbi:hypothetical protein PTMSG1_06562 [Pyrenophora teres f. maculata]|nr:hypothetical protein PTMSG1_06562 [Pyrenophora teres f. maculata]
MRVSLLLSYYIRIIPLVSTEFTIPNAKTVWNMGDRVTFRLSSSWPNWRDGPTSGDVLDFWVTSYDNHSYIQQYTSMRNPFNGGSSSWTVYAPERYVKDKNIFMFMFKDHWDNYAYDPTSWDYHGDGKHAYNANYA